MLRFMQVKCVIDSADVTAIDLSDSGIFLPLEEVFIGHHAMKYLEDELALTTSDIRQFRENCQKRLPLRHPLLCNLHWLQPGLQQYERLSQVLSVAACLPQVVKAEEKYPLQEEYMDYCMFSLPDEVKGRRRWIGFGIESVHFKTYRGRIDIPF